MLFWHCGVMAELVIHHITIEWCIFIDSSKSSFKDVLLHNGNKKPSIPVIYSVSIKETYDNMFDTLIAIKYKEFKWQICRYLKVTVILLGLQCGYIKGYSGYTNGI